MGEANEKIAQLELDARTVSNERYDLIAQIDQYKKQMGDLEKSFDAHKSDEDSLREEKATFLEQNQLLWRASEGNYSRANEKISERFGRDDENEEYAQSEKVQKAVRKGQVYPGRSRRDEENARREGAGIDRLATTFGRFSER